MVEILTFTERKMKRTLLTTCSCLLLAGGCLFGGCAGIKRVELGKPHEPPILELSVPGADLTVRALTVTIVREEDEQP